MKMPLARKVVIAGGSGFLGQIVARWFADRSYEVVVLTRTPRDDAGFREMKWNGETFGAWTAELEGALALINFAGRSVNCRYNMSNRRQMVNSRVRSTRILGQAIAQCAEPPRVWINASTATIYKHSIDCAMDESGEIGATPEAKDAFSIEVARAWEAAFNEEQTPRTRKVLARMAMVLGHGNNSVLPVMRRLARWGLGGTLGTGEQYVSWLHEEDLCRALEWLIANEEFDGVVNLAAPNPLPNREMMRLFRAICGVPIGLPASLWMLEVGAFVLRTETELLIKSRRVIPGRLLAAGFNFHFAHLAHALRELEGRAHGHNLQFPGRRTCGDDAPART